MNFRKLTSNELEKAAHIITGALVFVPMWSKVGILHTGDITYSTVI